MTQSTVELQEQLALTRHINNYGWYADSYAWDDIATCFTEDTVFNFKVAPDLEGQEPMNLRTGTINGRPNTAKALSSIVGKYKRTQHNILNMHFDIDSTGTTATDGRIFSGGEWQRRMAAIGPRRLARGIGGSFRRMAGRVAGRRLTRRWRLFGSRRHRLRDLNS